MPGLDLHPYSKPSMWRKMSLANWRHPTDPQVYGRLEIDMTNALAFAEQETERSGEKVTPTHLVARAIALALREFPSANAIIRWGRVYKRKNVDIFCQVAIPGKKPDLSGAVIREADRKLPGEISGELRELALKIKNRADTEQARARKSLDKIPGFLSSAAIGLIGFLQYTLNLELSGVGIPRDPFGSAMVTNVGSLGIAEAFAPLVPMSRVPIVISVGKIEKKPVVVDDELAIRPVCIIGATFDHRIMDGMVAGRLSRVANDYLSDPAAYEQQL